MNSHKKGKDIDGQRAIQPFCTLATSKYEKSTLADFQVSEE